LLEFESNKFELVGRADELEIALMEMVKEDNRRLLSAKVFYSFLSLYILF
jgi:hypothetical protein